MTARSKPSTARRANRLLWLGPLIATAGAISYFTVFYRYPTLRDFPWVNLPLVLIGLGCSTLALWRAYARPERFHGRITGWLSFGASLGLASLFCAYVFVLSWQLPASPAARALEQAPAFTLFDHTGRSFSLDALRGRKVVIVFYRGFW